MKIRQLFCRHKFLPWANITGDLIYDFQGCRTVMQCKKCGKRNFIEPYLEAPLDYNNIISYVAGHYQGMEEKDLWDKFGKFIIKDKDGYIESFGNRSILGKKL